MVANDAVGVVGLEPTKSSDSGFFRKLKELQSALVATGALPNFQVEPRGVEPRSRDFQSRAYTKSAKAPY